MEYILSKKEDGREWIFSKFGRGGSVQSVQGKVPDQFHIFNNSCDALACLEKIERAATGFRVRMLRRTTG